jgi:hypothetical protein
MGRERKAAGQIKTGGNAFRINEGEQFLAVHVWGKFEWAGYEYFLPKFAELAGRLRRQAPIDGFICAPALGV